MKVIMNVVFMLRHAQKMTQNGSSTSSRNSVASFWAKVSYAVLSFSSNHVFDRVNICIQPIEILWSMLSEKENGILTFSMYIGI